jgi:cell division septation protein DedD
LRKQNKLFLRYNLVSEEKMNPQLKQRLIGGAVLLAILVFAIPFLLHRPQPTAQNPAGVSANNQPQVELQLPQTAAATTNPAAPTAPAPESVAPQVASSAPASAPIAAVPANTSQPAETSTPTTPASTPTVSSATPSTAQESSSPQSAVAAPQESAAVKQEETAPTNSASSDAASSPAATVVDSDNNTSTNTSASETAPSQNNVEEAATTAKAITTENTAPTKDQDQTVANSEKPVMAAAAKPKINAPISSPLPYYLQVAAFSNISSANALVKRLASKGISAFAQTNAGAAGHTLTRVFAGPETQIAVIKKRQRQLKKEFGFNSVIRRNLP